MPNSEEYKKKVRIIKQLTIQIEENSSMKKNIKEYWIDTLYIMDMEQLIELRKILINEKIQIAIIEKKTFKK